MRGGTGRGFEWQRPESKGASAFAQKRSSRLASCPTNFMSDKLQFVVTFVGAIYNDRDKLKFVGH
jgi:hypothetical protein